MTSQQLAAPDGLTALVASEIRAMMGRLNVNRAELSRRLRVEDSWVGKRLNGRTEISLTDFQKIADALGVDIHDLLPRDRRTSPPTYAYEPEVDGTHPHPSHPIISMAIPLPHRPERIRKTDPANRKTAPTGR